MTSRRASCRRRVETVYPVVPGVIRDRSDEAVSDALRQAHQALPPMRRTQVTLVLYSAGEGLPIIAEAFGADVAEFVREQLDTIGGDDPTIVLATRTPQPRTQPERPTT